MEKSKKQITTFAAGEILFRQGDTSQHLYIIKNGEVKGYSIEGVFSKNIVQMSEEIKNGSDNSDNKLDKVLGKIYDLLD